MIAHELLHGETVQGRLDHGKVKHGDADEDHKQDRGLLKLQDDRVVVAISEELLEDHHQQDHLKDRTQDHVHRNRQAF